MANPYEGTTFQKVLDENLRTNWGKDPDPEEHVKKEGGKDEKADDGNRTSI